MSSEHALPTSALRRRCKPEAFSFGSTAGLPPLKGFVGQPRAVAALEFALDMDSGGYHVFVAGANGSGRENLALKQLKERAKARGPAHDWCYVNSFDNPREPLALRLPAGRGRVLREDMEKFVEDVQAAIPTAFESDEYRERRRSLEQQLEDQQQEVFRLFERRATERGLTFMNTAVGMVFAPARDGEVMTPEDFKKAPKEEQESFEHESSILQDELRAELRLMQGLARDVRRQVRELDREVTRFAVEHLLDALRERHGSLPRVFEWIDAVQVDVITHAHEFLKSGRKGGDGTEAALEALGQGKQPQDRYAVNLLVDNADTQGAPLVLEDSPNLGNLLGRVEHVSHLGALVTDFTHVEAGALHQANGGYLVLDARRLLTRPSSWESLKQALRAGEIRIESLSETLGFSTTVSLQPEPIPLQVKVILLGEAHLYYLLCRYDSEFEQLFEVIADLDDGIDWTEDAENFQARWIAELARTETLLPLEGAAVALIIEQGARLMGDQKRLNMGVDAIAGMVRESEQQARKAGMPRVAADHVRAALAAQEERAGRIRERMLSATLRGTLVIDTEGDRIGQINGLSVLQLGGYRFGRPGRITARVRMGRGQVVDIEREVELGGALHTKGVLILSSYLGSRYSHREPLSISASLVFEQSYGGVDGDSASVAELLCLLSAIAGLPLKQSLAVTGSIDQHGRVQAIGGVNEKIEGFFDLCAARGLDGSHGVVIPSANREHLMLHPRVIDAVEDGTFHVSCVSTVDEAAGLFMGHDPGEEDPEGLFPEGSINRHVTDRLSGLARDLASFGKSEDKEDAGESEG